MERFRATRTFHLGALRTEIKKGHIVKIDGDTIDYRGKRATAAGLDDLISSGLLEPLDEPLALVPAESASVKVHTPNVQEEEEPKPKATWEDPDKPHQWEADLFGSGGKTCSVCGVTLANPMSVNLSKQSMTYQYTDAYGVTITSLTPLPCPTFVGDYGGAIMGNTKRARDLRNHVEDMEVRLAELEADNRFLEAEAQQRQEAALKLLERLTVAAERLVELGDAQSGPALLEDHGEILDAILVTPRDEREKVPVYAVPEEEDEPRRKLG